MKQDTALLFSIAKHKPAKVPPHACSCIIAKVIRGRFDLVRWTPLTSIYFTLESLMSQTDTLLTASHVSDAPASRSISSDLSPTRHMCPLSIFGTSSTIKLYNGSDLIGDGNGSL